MRYEELIVALHEAGIPIKATLQVLYTLPPKKEPQILVRWGKDSKGEESLLCYVGLEYGLAEATAVPLEEVTPAHIIAYTAAWKAQHDNKPLPGHKKMPIFSRDGKPQGLYLIKEDLA